MKQITKKQMNELKGMLNDMDYNPANLINLTTVTANSQDNTVCKAKNIVSDID
jgi:hypothetical protein